MTDSGWDNHGQPAPKKGLSTGAKVALGCGLAFVLAVGGCVAAVGGVAYWGVKKGGGALDQAWTEIRADIQELRTDAGARKLYQENPGLADRYPSAEEFVKASASWRARLEEFPEKRPELRELFSDKKGLQFSSHYEKGRKRTQVRYPLPKGGVLRFESENDRLVDIGVD